MVTADVIDSRKSDLNQAALRQQLGQLEHATLLVPFSLSRGDEVQGVVAGWLSTSQLVRRLRWFCRPHQLRVGIGIGYSEGVLGDAWQMSGPAFFRAREALESIGAVKEPATRIATGAEGLDTLVNSVWLLLDTLMSQWTSGQWKAVMTYECAGTYAAAAEILGVAAQNVQKRCKAAHWNEVRQAEQSLSQVEGMLAVYHPLLGEKTNITQ